MMLFAILGWRSDEEPDVKNLLAMCGRGRRAGSPEPGGSPGSNSPVLVGKDLPRAYEFAGKQLIVKSTRRDEHWRVVWERY